MKKLLRGIRRHEALLQEGGRFCGVAAAMIGSAVVGGVVSSSNASKAAKAAQAGTTTKTEIDPRMGEILYGANGNNGLLSQFQGFMNQPQSAALQGYGNASDAYLNGNTAGDMDSIRNTAYGLMGGNQAPTFQGAQSGISQADRAMAGRNGSTQIQSAFTPGVSASQVDAPAQNNLNLSGAFDRTINGDAAANPYLTGSLKAATDLTNASFSTNQNNVTNALQRQVLPSLRSGAIAAGQYGGSRQGIAEGLALSDYTNQLTNANTQLGAANSANTTAQMAGAFNQGQDRSLSALLNLSGQQYGVASQNASMRQQADQFNSSQTQATNALNAQLGATNNQFNAGLWQANDQFNANQAQQNSQFNANAANAGNQFNAQMAQQAWQANQGAMLQTNQQNNAGALAGSGLLSGLLGTALSGSANAQNYSLNQAQAVNGLLSPYIGVNSSSNTSQPYAGSAAGSGVNGALGGAAAGLSLYNMYNQSSGSGYNAQDIRNTTSM